MVTTDMHEEDAAAEATVAALLEAVVSADRMINALTATRAGLIEALRVASVEPDPAPSTTDGDGTAGVGDDPVAAARAAELLDLRQDLDLRSMTAELACALHIPHATAAHLIDDAHVLATDLPATAAALSEGVITYRHAQTMITIIAGLDPGKRARAETILIPKATVMTRSAFTRAVNRTRNLLDPTPLADRHAAAATGRTVLLEADIDGMAWLHAHLPATAATAIFHRLSDAAATLAHPDDPRTLPQLRADALAALTLDDDAHDAFTHAMTITTDHDPAHEHEHEHEGEDAGDGQDNDAAGDRGDSTDGSGGSSGGADTKTSGISAEDQYRHRTRASAQRMRQTLRGIRPTVAVTIPVLTLLGADAPAELEGYGPIDADTARQLCADAPSFLRILTHPHTGAILGVDRDRYTVPADLRSWLRLRDETCRFPGCSRRAQRCDIDHVTDWATGGTTDQTNLIHLCRTHHRLRHRTRWQATITTTPPDTSRPDGPRTANVRWTAPSGRTYTTTDAILDQHAAHGTGNRRGHQGVHPPDQRTGPPPAAPPTGLTTDSPPAPPATFPEIPPF